MSDAELATAKTTLEEALTAASEKKKAKAMEGGLKSGADAPVIALKKMGGAVKQQSKLNGVHWLDNSIFGMACQDGTCVVYNGQDCGMRYYYKLNTWLNTCAFDRTTAGTDDCRFAVGGLDNIVTVLRIPHKSIKEEAKYENVPQGDQVKKTTYEKHGGPINDIKFWGNQMLSCSGDATVMLWDVDDSKKTIKEPAMTFKGHEGDVGSISLFEGDSNCFVSGSSDMYCKIFDKRLSSAEKAAVAQTFAGHVKAVTMVKTFGAHNFASSGEDGTIRLWDVRSGAQCGQFGTTPGEEDDVTECSSIEFSKSGRILFAGYEDGTLSAIDTLTGEKVDYGCKQHHQNRITQMCMSPDGWALTSCSREASEKNNFQILVKK